MVLVAENARTGDGAIEFAPRMLVKRAHKMPLITGHEISGHIVDPGDGVDGWTKDELVAIPPLLPCNECPQCLTGNFSRCHDGDIFGSRRDGAYAEYVAVPVTNRLKPPEGVAPPAIAMVDPASIALHAIWKSGSITAGQTGGVIGCGPIGLFAIQWMRMMGASDVIAVDVSPKKLELAREAGANIRVLSSEFDENTARADLVVEAVGLDVTINSAVMLAAPSGHVSFIGIPVPDLTLSTKTFQTFLRQGMSLHGS